MRSDELLDSEDDPSCVLLLLVVLCIAVGAVNPGCECLVYSATYGKEYGTFSSPDYPRPYPPSINCLLYTFIAGANEIIELIFKDFDVQKTQLDTLAIYPHSIMVLRYLLLGTITLTFTYNYKTPLFLEDTHYDFAAF